MDAMVRRFIVRGRVQGVGFRWFVDHEARQIGIRGWVRNNPDGTVEVLAVAAEAEMEVLRTKLHQGSRGSRVDAVNETEVPGQAPEEFTDFRIEGAW